MLLACEQETCGETQGGSSDESSVVLLLWGIRAALNYAVIRGDIEIVKILLENSADPYIENDLGMNAFDTCKDAGPFPSVQRVLEGYLDEEQKE